MRNVRHIFAWLLLAAFSACGQSSFTNLISQGAAAQARGDVTNAFQFFQRAQSATTNCADLCLLTKRYCDLMHDTPAEDLQKSLAQTALACARNAVKADSSNATARLTLAVCYVKNFPYANNRTKVEWSKGIKSECETAIALDPKQDVGYYLLGRWHVGVADMNFFYKGLVKIIYGGLPRASHAEAIQNFKQAIALAPGRIIHRLELAKVYAETGEKKLAIAELETCAALKPTDRDDGAAQKEAAKLLAELR